MLYYIGTMDTNLDTNLDTNRSNRLDNLKSWLASCYKLNKDLINLIALNNDASFRKYYRFIYNNQSFIAVDSPPTQEKNNEFIAVQNILYNNNVNVPSIISTNLEQGYFILEDFGDEILLPKLFFSFWLSLNFYLCKII
jgi:aminoglycoside/choline kinase family phosphotransferase